MAVIVKTNNLGIGYPGAAVGRNLDVEIAADRVTMLLGPNGCGKTTLFRTMLGLLEAQAGVVTLDGAPLRDLSRGHIAKRIAYVPQVAQGYFPFSVLDVVLMGRAPYLGMFEAPGENDRRIAFAALESLGLAEIAARPFTEISGGQRQLALIARGLAQDAPVLIMDEPTANLDYGNQHRILIRSRSLATGGRAVVISTHNPEHALAYADHVILMNAGGIMAAGAADEVLNAEALSIVYDMAINVSEIEDRAGNSRRIISPG